MRYQTTWRHVFCEYRRDILIFTAACAVAVAIGAYAIPASAWQGEGDTTNPGEVAPGAKGFGHSGGGSSTDGQPVFKFCGNVCGWNSNKPSGKKSKGGGYNDNGSGRGVKAHNDQSAPGKN